MTNKTTKTTRTTTTLESAPEQMVAVWRNRISDQKVELTDTRKVMLRVLFKNIFCENMSRWNEFIDMILKKDAFMKKASKSFDWAITPQHCLTILESTYLTPAYLGEAGTFQDDVSSRC